MSESLIVDWLNENEHRAYPLRETANRFDGIFRLDDDVIVDALLVYASAPSYVRLESLVTTGLTATFTVSGPQVFVVTLADPFPQYVRLVNGSLLVVTDKVLNIASGQSYTFTNNDFEDSVVYEFNDEWKGLSSLKIGESTTLTNDIELEAGLQFKVDIDGQNLVLGASRNFGSPIDCTTYGIVANDCTSILSSINGVVPDSDSKMLFDAGANVIVLDDPTNHRLFIGLTFKPDDLCRVIYANPVGFAP